MHYCLLPLARACTKERGASLVEAAAVLPIFLFVFLGLIDFARYLSIKNTLDIAAHQALTLAEVIPDLELQEGDDRFESARIQVAERARQVRNHPLFQYGAQLHETTPEQILSIPDYVPALGTRDFSSALTVALHADLFLLSLPWTSHLTLHARVSGYREPKIKVSFPIPLNCNGVPPILHEDIVCDCPDNQVSMWNECHTCEPGKVKQSATQCVCEQKTCGAYEAQDPKTCACVCAPGASGTTGNCGCNGNANDINGTCVCKSHDELHCRPDQVVDPASCQCVCKNPLQVDQGGVCVCSNTCDNDEWLDSYSCNCQRYCNAGCKPRFAADGSFIDCKCGGSGD